MQCTGSLTYPKLPKNGKLKEILRRGGLRCCSPENICLQCWLCFTCIEKKVGTEFSEETAASYFDDESFYGVIIVIQISVCSFTFTGLFPSSPTERDHQSFI